MPTGRNHQSQHTTKLLNIGQPGTGKTGALVCLVEAGYRLIVVDFDNGTDIIFQLLHNNEKALDKFYYETFTDKLKMISVGGSKPNDVIVPIGTPTAWTRAMMGLTNWKFPVAIGSKETYNLGNASTWGSDTILVIDSLGFAAVAALRLVRSLNGNQMENFVSKYDFGQAMEKVETLLQLLYAVNIKCHVIVNTHVIFQEDLLRGTQIGLPRALGSKLPPKVGGYFNTIVHSATVLRGKTTERMIKTVSDGVVELKVPVIPGKLKEALPIQTGLLTIFKALQQHTWTEEAKEQEELRQTV